jgi:SPRY domain
MPILATRGAIAARNYGLFGAIPVAYQISRSLRFRASNSAYLSRTPASASNRTTWTWSGWVKRSGLGGIGQVLFSATGGDTFITFNGSTYQGGAGNTDGLGVKLGGAGFSWGSLALFRDVSAWYHIVVAYDSTQSTSTNRLKVYVNNNQLTADGSSSYPGLNMTTDIDNTVSHAIGRISSSSTAYFDGYMAEVNFIDGQALTPSSFGQTDPTIGVWSPLAYTGTYGTNGFYLPFTGNSQTASPVVSLGSATSTGVQSSNSFTTTSSIAIGDLVVVGVQIGSNTTVPTVSSVSDGSANIYSLAKRSTAYGNTVTEIWYTKATAAVSSGATITATWSGSNGGLGAAHAIMGAKATGVGISASPLDVAVTANATTTTPTLSSGSLSQANEIVFAFSAGQASVTNWSPNFNNIVNTFQSGNYNQLSYNLPISTSAVSDAPVFSSSTPTTLTVCSFKLSASSNIWPGRDLSGQSNEWTPSGISVTAGTTNDSLVDSPTNYGSDTGAGGEVRGNYCTLNPLYYLDTSLIALSNGNLTAKGVTNNYGRGRSSWLFAGTEHQFAEFTITAIGSDIKVGVANVTSTSTSYVGSDANSWCYDDAGRKGNNGSFNSYGASFTTGDVLGVEWNNGTLTFYKNGSSQGSAFTGLSTSVLYCFAVSVNNTSSIVDCNFGQRAWAYTPPSGTKALCTQNLTTPAIVNGASYMAATLYTGTGSSQSPANSQSNGGNNALGKTFYPDLTWIKSRSAATDHKLTDSVRGVTKALISDTSGAETTDTNGLTAFSSTGFTVGSDTNYNNNTATYVAWQWNANSGSSSSNTSGTITSTVSANTTAGFSVVTWTGTSSSATIGHGISVAPSMIIAKCRVTSAVYNSWGVYHTSLDNTKYLELNSTGAAGTSSTWWNNTSPTSSVFSIGTQFSENNSTYVAYCFAAIPGFSAFGSYTGNGSADGPFVFCGFRPRWVMIKRTDTTANWRILDTARDTFNAEQFELYPNLSNAESTFTSLDGLSNGFKIRNTDVAYNSSGGTYIYAAFAENPFKYSRAR